MIKWLKITHVHCTSINFLVLIPGFVLQLPKMKLMRKTGWRAYITSLYYLSNFLWIYNYFKSKKFKTWVSWKKLIQIPYFTNRETKMPKGRMTAQCFRISWCSTETLQPLLLSWDLSFFGTLKTQLSPVYFPTLTSNAHSSIAFSYIRVLVFLAGQISLKSLPPYWLSPL